MGIAKYFKKMVKIAYKRAIRIKIIGACKSGEKKPGVDNT
jgi:hypothetical protein